MITIEFGIAIAVVTIACLRLIRHAARMLTAIRGDFAEMRRNSDQGAAEFADLCRAYDPRRQHRAQVLGWAAANPDETHDLCEEIYRASGDDPTT